MKALGSIRVRLLLLYSLMVLSTAWEGEVRYVA